MRKDTLNKHDVKVSKTCRQLTKRNALKLYLCQIYFSESFQLRASRKV